MKVLIVEDTMETAISLQQLFESNGYKTIVVEDAEGALDALKKEKVDIVVSDINLHRMDGFELSRTIKKQDVEMPIVLYTSMDAPADFYDLAKRIGVDQLIPNANQNIKEMVNIAIEKLNNAFDRHEAIATKILKA